MILGSSVPKLGAIKPRAMDPGPTPAFTHKRQRQHHRGRLIQRPVLATRATCRGLWCSEAVPLDVFGLVGPGHLRGDHTQFTGQKLEKGGPTSTTNHQHVKINLHP